MKTLHTPKKIPIGPLHAFQQEARAKAKQLLAQAAKLIEAKLKAARPDVEEGVRGLGYKRKSLDGIEPYGLLPEEGVQKVMSVLFKSDLSSSVISCQDPISKETRSLPANMKDGQWVSSREIIAPHKLDRKKMAEVLSGTRVQDVVLQKAARPGRYAVVDGEESVAAAKVLGLPAVWGVIVPGTADVHGPTLEHLVGIQKAKDEAAKHLFILSYKLLPLAKMANRLSKAEFLNMTKGQKTKEEEQVLATADQKDRERVQTWNRLYQQGRKDGLDAMTAKARADGSLEYKKEQLTAEAALVAARNLEIRWAEEREALGELLGMPNVEPMLLWEKARSIPVYKSLDLQEVLTERVLERGEPLEKAWNEHARELALEARRARMKERDAEASAIRRERNQMMPGRQFSLQFPEHPGVKVEVPEKAKGPAAIAAAEAHWQGHANPQGVVGPDTQREARLENLRAQGQKLRDEFEAAAKTKESEKTEPKKEQSKNSSRSVSPEQLTVPPSPNAPYKQIGGDHVSQVFKAKLENGQAVIYKPLSKEDMREIKEKYGIGNGALREAAASAIARAAGAGHLVPTAVYKKGDLKFGEGSVAQFVPNAATAASVWRGWRYLKEYEGKESEVGNDTLKYMNIGKKFGWDDVKDHPLAKEGGMKDLLGTKLDKNEVQHAALFDYVVGNIDRHGENWMVSKASKSGGFHISLIDNALTLPSNPIRQPSSGLMRYIKDGGRIAIPKALRDGYVNNLDKIIGAVRNLGVEEKAIAGMKDRISKLSKPGWKFSDLMIER